MPISKFSRDEGVNPIGTGTGHIQVLLFIWKGYRQSIFIARYIFVHR